MKTPTLETPPSGISGKRQTALARVTATKSCVSARFITSPFGLGTVPISRSSAPSRQRARVDERRHRPARRIEVHHAVLVVGNDDAAVLVELQSVRLPVIFGDQRPFAARGDAEDAAERDVDDPEIALAIEARPLEETVERLAAPVRVGPDTALLFARMP